MWRSSFVTVWQNLSVVRNVRRQRPALLPAFFPVLKTPSIRWKSCPVSFLQIEP